MHAHFAPEVTVVVHGDGRIELLHGQEILPCKVFDAAQDVPEPLDIFILPNYRTFLFCLARG
ncbi:MAG: hypothetical protein PHF02_09595 [Tepidiphilus sp.]|jgi:hypothetical protein|nr:hypothetical protein [Tepidiphilus sp.]MDD3434219.1 hypothetical protein [Tepidiphilus sp.]